MVASGDFPLWFGLWSFRLLVWQSLEAAVSPSAFTRFDCEGLSSAPVNHGTAPAYQHRNCWLHQYWQCCHMGWFEWQRVDRHQQFLGGHDSNSNDGSIAFDFAAPGTPRCANQHDCRHRPRTHCSRDDSGWAHLAGFQESLWPRRLGPTSGHSTIWQLLHLVLLQRRSRHQVWWTSWTIRTLLCSAGRSSMHAM